MSCEVSKATEGLENELWRRWSDVRHSSFFNPCVALPTSQLILQPLLSLPLHHRLFTYITWRAAHAGLFSTLIDIFNDDHILHLRSDTVAANRRMNMVSDHYDGQMIPWDECGPDFLIFFLQLSKKPGKILQPVSCPDRGSNPAPLHERQLCYLCDHSSGLFRTCDISCHSQSS